SRYRTRTLDYTRHHRGSPRRNGRRDERSRGRNPVYVASADCWARSTEGSGMRRILFVDDDRLLLDGLRGRLHTLRDAWEMVFVESGPRAITELEQGKFDVIVTDMRMPGMDGLELLKVV